MRLVEKVINYIKSNKEWIFSGIGIPILSLVISMIFFSSEDKTIDVNDLPDDKNNIEVEGIVNGDIYQDNIINILGGEKEEPKLVEKELVIEINGDKVYPINIDILDERKVDGWVYFRYIVEETYNGDVVTYPVLFRYKEGEYIAKRVSDRACYAFEVAKDCVYYLDSTIDFQDYGELYVSRPDGKKERLLDNELYDFQIVGDQYIYYTYRHDTVGVGLECHALHRMNLNGSEIMIAAYEVSGVDFGVSHFDYKVVDGWVDCGAFKMELGEPADGLEKIVFNNVEDNDWVYYVTNRLIKARKDGSEIVELDGVDDYYYHIEKVEDDWIYYIKGEKMYKIRTDGSGKEKITKIQIDEKNDDNQKVIMPESKYLEYLQSNVNRDIIFSHYDDYDGDGLYEVFAIVESNLRKEYEEYSDYYGTIWFINHNSAIEIEGDAKNYYPPLVFVMGGKVFVAFSQVWSTGSIVYIWGVADEEPYEPMISGKASDIRLNEFNELELTHSTYDLCFDKEIHDEFDDDYIDKYGNVYPLLSGHTWKNYYFYFDGNVFKEYGGINIEIDDLLRSDKGREIVEKIYEESYIIDSIYYRENGIININISKEDDKSIRYSNLTLRCDDGKLDIVPSEWGEYNEGIYLDAMIPEIATYPSGYPY